MLGVVYEMAGSYRDIYYDRPEPLLGDRSIGYAQPNPMIDGDPTMINSIRRAFSKLEALKDQKDDPKAFVKTLAEGIKDLWVTQPFIEGNTRTIGLFTHALVNHHKLEMSMHLTNWTAGIRFRDMLVMAASGNPSELEKTLERAVKFPTPELGHQHCQDSSESQRMI
jgi:fido (protein-threonine AMPylation protein)